MKRKLVLRPIANVEIADACNSYTLSGTARAQQFLREVDEALRYIEENPLASAVRPHGMRQRNLKTFPRSLIYLVVEGFDEQLDEVFEKVVILGCIHQNQDDAPLSQRLDI